MLVRILLAFLLVLAPYVQADDASQWLARLADSRKETTFQGTFIYERNGNFSTHNLWHRTDSDGTVRERLLQLDGPWQESLRVGERVVCASEGLVSYVDDGQPWPLRSLNLSVIHNWYDIRFLEKSRVAGRPVTVLRITPKDQNRYGYELHLDEETALPLKFLLLNEKGLLLERFQFTSFNVEEVTDAQIGPSQDCLPIPPAPPEVLSTTPWFASWLPPGFHLSKTLLKNSAVTTDKVTWMAYDDGLARFSIFLEPLHGVAVEGIRSQLGPTVILSRRLPTDDGGMMITVVGEIPLGTAERIALSMHTEHD